MTEIWKPIEGHEKYLISTKGRVLSTKTNTILKANKDKKGYLRIKMYDKGNFSIKVHREVAKAFLPNPDNLPQVNHKDEDKQNNNVENLEWCTNDYNSHYGTCHERTRIANINHKSTSVPVKCIETGKVYPSINEAQRETGAKNVFYVCIGKRHTSGNYHWEYANNIRRTDNKIVKECV